MPSPAWPSPDALAPHTTWRSLQAGRCECTSSATRTARALSMIWPVVRPSSTASNSTSDTSPVLPTSASCMYCAKVGSAAWNLLQLLSPCPTTLVARASSDWSIPIHSRASPNCAFDNAWSRSWSKRRNSWCTCGGRGGVSSSTAPASSSRGGRQWHESMLPRRRTARAVKPCSLPVTTSSAISCRLRTL